eukprot:7762496-Pyramimonas_sp.AAC.1
MRIDVAPARWEMARVEADKAGSNVNYQVQNWFEHSEPRREKRGRVSSRSTAWRPESSRSTMESWRP